MCSFCLPASMELQTVAYCAWKRVFLKNKIMAINIIVVLIKLFIESPSFIDSLLIYES